MVHLLIFAGNHCNISFPVSARHEGTNSFTNRSIGARYEVKMSIAAEKRSECCRNNAAIHSSLDGIGVPAHCPILGGPYIGGVPSQFALHVRAVCSPLLPLSLSSERPTLQSWPLQLFCRSSPASFATPSTSRTVPSSWDRGLRSLAAKTGTNPRSRLAMPSV